MSDAPNVEMYNLNDLDGLSEGAFYGIMATPSIIVVDDGGKELKSFRGEVPTRAQMAEWIIH